MEGSLCAAHPFIARSDVNPCPETMTFIKYCSAVNARLGLLLPVTWILCCDQICKPQTNEIHLLDKNVVLPWNWGKSERGSPFSCKKTGVLAFGLYKTDQLRPKSNVFLGNPDVCCCCASPKCARWPPSPSVFQTDKSLFVSDGIGSGAV